mgnify:CR=1 FL=1
MSRDEKHIADAREVFEASDQSDFFTLMRAYQFAVNSRHGPEQCRRRGVHWQVARQVEQTFQQILEIARRERLLPRAGETAASAESDAAGPAESKPDDDTLLRCVLAGFVDQLCVRRDRGTLDCNLSEGRAGVLMRESVVQNAPLFIAASIREVASRGGDPMTLLGMAAAVKRDRKSTRLNSSHLVIS